MAQTTTQSSGLCSTTLNCEGDRSGLQEIPQLNYSMEYVTTHLQEISQRIR